MNADYVCAFDEFCKYGSCGEECAFSEFQLVVFSLQTKNSVLVLVLASGLLYLVGILSTRCLKT